MVDEEELGIGPVLNRFTCARHGSAAAQGFATDPRQCMKCKNAIKLIAIVQQVMDSTGSSTALTVTLLTMTEFILGLC